MGWLLWLLGGFGAGYVLGALSIVWLRKCNREAAVRLYGHH